VLGEIYAHEFVENPRKEDLSTKTVEVIVPGEQVEALALRDLAIVPKDVESLGSLADFALSISVCSKVWEQHYSDP
jgi:hypothetical protein